MCFFMWENKVKNMKYQRKDTILGTQWELQV